MAQLVMHWTLDFSSGHDLRVLGSSQTGSMFQGVCLSILSLLLPLPMVSPPTIPYILSLKRKKKDLSLVWLLSHILLLQHSYFSPWTTIWSIFLKKIFIYLRGGWHLLEAPLIILPMCCLLVLHCHGPGEGCHCQCPLTHALETGTPTSRDLFPYFFFLRFF